MKTYELVIENSLEKLIEVTNEATTYGYFPVGGMIYIESEQKFIQTIIKIKTKNQMEKQFFTELAEQLNDKQSITLRVMKTGDSLTTLITIDDKKQFTASGTPEEMDIELLGSISEQLKKKSSFTVTEIEEKEEEEVEDEEKGDAGDKKEPSKTKKRVIEKAPSKSSKKDVKLETPADTKPEEKKEEEPAKDLTANIPRYSDDELTEFKEIIDEKILAAEIDLKTEYAGLTQEELKQLRERQKKFIINLQNALVRIENKTYGICRATGKLISKERLRSIPHATLAIESEEIQETPSVKETLKVETKKQSAPDANKTRIFNSYMSEGAQLFVERKYKEAQLKFQEALKIFPNDKTAIEEESKASKWVKHMEAADL